MMTLPHDVKGLMAHITKQMCIYRQTFHISIYYTQLFVHNISFGQTENPYQFHASECLRVTISLSYIKENFHKNLLRTTMNYTGWPQVWVKKRTFKAVWPPWLQMRDRHTDQDCQLRPIQRSPRQWLQQGNASWAP